MSKLVTPETPERQVLLMTRSGNCGGDYIALVALVEDHLTTSVMHKQVQSAALSCSHGTPAEASRRFAQFLSEASEHDWRVFYVGAPLRG